MTLYEWITEAGGWVLVAVMALVLGFALGLRLGR